MAPNIEVEQAVLNQKIISTAEGVARIEQEIKDYRNEQKDTSERITTIEALFDPKLGNRVTVVEGITQRLSKVMWALVLLVLGGFITALMNGLFMSN